MAKNLNVEKVKDAYRELSFNLDKATKAAVQIAFQTTIVPKIKEEGLRYLPFRPVIVGGDDVTVISRGDVAIDFTARFLKEFEKETKSVFTGFDAKYCNGHTLFSNGLTACAGIAFIKSHYPFHYGVHLAESLTKEAKKASKPKGSDETFSSLLFHKMHSSFVREWDEIKDHELQSGKVSFLYGPYFLNANNPDGKPSIEQLQYWASEMQREVAPRSNIRQWLSMLAENKVRAADLGKRTYQTLKQREVWDKLSLEQMRNAQTIKETHLYDVLNLADLLIKKENK